ncbi:MAG: Ig-like domain-containing protein, partial [Odoribacter sp.]|nr:Ig-like domain-containing protein [Odoribacter sp.]
TLPPISENKAYIFSTQNEGEFFVLENRDPSTPWDKHINFSDQGQGLLVFHVDRSENMVNGRRAKERWAYSGVNNVLAHCCFRPIPATGSKNYKQGDPGSKMFFPGIKNVTQLNFVPWSGEILENRLEKIRLENNLICFSYYNTATLAEQVILSSREAAIEALHHIQLTATLLPEDVSNSGIIWSSSNDSIARVNDKGLVTGIQAGTATIIARSADGNAQASCIVTVQADELEENQKLDIGQREVRIAWTEPETPQIWLVKWKKAKNQNFQVLESDTTVFIINQLEPDTEYELEITAMINDKETAPLIKKTYRTRPLEGEFPVIYGIRPDWTEGDRFWPIVNNIPGEVRRITWKLDDKPFPVSYDLILPAGEHKLQAEITTGDGTTETIIRQIFVKSKQK